VDEAEEERLEKERKEQERRKLFEDLIDMDFTETSIKTLLEIPFDVEDDDEELNLNSFGMLKLMKM